MQTSRAGFHHRSTKITLLHAVKFSPAPPALKEIKMTRVDLLLRIFSSDTSRCFAFIDPSSNKCQRQPKLVKNLSYSHRTKLIPSSRRNGSSRSSIVVNCEKIIVFSSPWPCSSTTSRSSIILRILADEGGRLEPARPDLRRFSAVI